MSDNPDRTVHGRSHSGLWEVVRYDRAGKWYLESSDGGRVRATLDHAAVTAAQGEFFPRLPGGRAFDHKVREYRRRLADAARA